MAILAALLIIESLFAGLYVGRLVPALAGHDLSVVAVILARGGVGALQFAAGWMLANRRPPGPALAGWAWLAAAVWTTLAVGLNLAPTMVYPWWRWQVTAAYCAYAAVGILIVRRLSAGPPA